MKCASLFLILQAFACSLYGIGFLNATQDVFKGFPHQIGVADIICTGTVLTNNDEFAELSLNEVLWGYAPSSNITVRCLEIDDKPAFMHNEEYLVFAYTNNWWGREKLSILDIYESSDMYLLDFLAITNRPANNALFSEFRIINSTQSVMRLDDLVVGGTNYWPATRTFITNFIEITRIKHDEAEAYRYVSTFGNLKLRRREKLKLIRYLYSRYLGTEYWREQ